MSLRFRKCQWICIAAVVACPGLNHASSYPDWWFERGIIKADAQMDDYAVCNQGQLKNFALAMAAELADQELPGGLGDEINNLIASWNSSLTADDYAAVNLGQVKAVALPFYQKMHGAGIIQELPSWLQNFDNEVNFQIANIGQLKQVFNITALDDLTNNGMPESEQTSNSGVGSSAASNMTSGIQVSDMNRFPGLGLGFQNGQELLHDDISRLVRVGWADVEPRQILTLDPESNVTNVANFPNN